MQTAVLGSPGSFKTTSFVLPNIFHIPYMYKNLDEKGDIIITDSKSEIYCLTSKYLAGCGYDVYALVFFSIEKYGDSLNPINYISSDKELMEIAEGYISSVSDATILSYRSDTFWEESEGQLLGSLIGFVKEICPAGQQTFGEILKILTSENVRNPEKALNFFKEYNIKGTPLELWGKVSLRSNLVSAGEETYRDFYFTILDSNDTYLSKRNDILNLTKILIARRFNRTVFKNLYQIHNWLYLISTN